LENSAFARVIQRGIDGPACHAEKQNPGAPNLNDHPPFAENLLSASALPLDEIVSLNFDFSVMHHRPGVLLKRVMRVARPVAVNGSLVFPGAQ